MRTEPTVRISVSPLNFRFSSQFGKVGVMNKVQATIKFAEDNLEDLDPFHNMRHADLTVKFAKIIAEKENANSELCVIAALLHDIGRGEEWKKETIEENHGIDGARKAEPFLSSIKLSKEEIAQVCEAISQHCFPNTQTNQIAKILWDADKLNLFSKEMKQVYVRCWKEKGWSDGKIAELIKTEREFYFKTFHTEIARKIAEDNFNI